MDDLNDKITGGTLTANEWNQVASELQNVIESAGLTLSSGDLQQLAKSVSAYASYGGYYTDSGAANAYVLDTVGSRIAPPSYGTGEHIAFIAGNANTGACTINRDSGGVKNLKFFGADMPNGLIQVGTFVEAYYDGTDFQACGAWITIADIMQTVITTSNSSWAPESNCLKMDILAIGGGGGGGGAAATSAGESAGGAGGAASSVVQQFEVIPGTGLNITIGAGGAGGAIGASGSAGTATTISNIGGGTTVAIDTGAGNGGSTVGPSTGGPGVGGPNSSTPSGGNLTHRGQSGQSMVLLSGGAVTRGGDGGSSYFGGGARGPIGGSNAADASNYGSGGAGGFTRNASSGYTGGDGGDGLVVITQYLTAQP